MRCEITRGVPSPLSTPRLSLPTYEVLRIWPELTAANRREVHIEEFVQQWKDNSHIQDTHSGLRGPLPLRWILAAHVKLLSLQETGTVSESA